MAPRGVAPGVGWRRAIGWAVLGTLAAALLIIATAEWWLPPALKQFVWSRAQRRVELAGLDLGLTAALEPTVRLRGLRIDNAAWADPRPFVVAREVRFTFAWRSLRERRIVVSRLDLIDAQVDLEREADGLRNWRLSSPQDRGPGKIRIVSLDARDSSVRFVHRGEHLELETAIAALASPDERMEHGLALSKRLSLQGQRNGQRFEGRLDVSDVLSFVDSGVPFAVRGDAKTAQTTLHIDGTVADLAKLGDVDARIELSGASLHELQAPLQYTLPGTKPYRLAAHLRKTGPRAALTGLTGRLGTSEFSGQIVRTLRDDEGEGGDDKSARPAIEAHLRSPHVDWSDLTAIRSGHSPGADLSTLRDIDLQATLDIATLSTPWPLQLRALTMKAALERGVLTLSPFQVGSAGGTLAGRATLDARRNPPALDLEVDADGLRIDRLLPSQPENRRVDGAVRGRVVLHSTGATPAEMLANAEGRVSAQTRGATIASSLDARLALNGGRVLRTLLEGNEPVPVRCVAAEWQIRRGALHSRRLVMETDRLKLVGTGSVDLANRSLALTFTPQRKQAALFALQRSIRVSGPFESTQVALAEAPAPAAQDSCLEIH